MTADKLKAVLQLVAAFVEQTDMKGIIFAYDEAQNLADAPAKDEYPLSLLLDVFQSLQRRGTTFMLALTGLPTLFPKLVEARTYSERMFRVISLGKLGLADSRKAILRPIQAVNCPVTFSEASVNQICDQSSGYPYFIQFICKEAFDVIVQEAQRGELAEVPVYPILRKLDSDFFAGRWAKATDRQRELLWVIATLNKSESEFTVSEVVAQSAELLQKPFSSSRVNQILVALAEAGFVYKNRWGKYLFAVPLFDQFILRQGDASEQLPPFVQSPADVRE